MSTEDKYLLVIVGLLGVRLCACWVRTRSAKAAAVVPATRL